ncbi:MAG: hypothetical protein R6V76_03230, partial [Desulfobacterales bacterium]
MKLQTKLLTLYAVSTILIMIALGVFFYSTLWKERIGSVREDILNQLQSLDFSLNAFFTEVEDDVNNLAASETVKSKDDREFTNFLDADEKTYKYNIRES